MTQDAGHSFCRCAMTAPMSLFYIFGRNNYKWLASLLLLLNGPQLLGYRLVYYWPIIDKHVISTETACHCPITVGEFTDNESVVQGERQCIVKDESSKLHDKHACPHTGIKDRFKIKKVNLLSAIVPIYKRVWERSCVICTFSIVTLA